MNNEEFILHWNYFCSLAIRLEETKNYVHHGIVDNDGFKLIHADVCSDAFKQIIILAASEFENVARIICKSFGKTTRSIEGISRLILGEFPRIVETEVITLFWQGKPLYGWRIVEDDKKKKVHGIEWWNAYNSLKHNKENSYKQATLNNAVFSLAALYILDLYLMQLQFNNLRLLQKNPPVYFKCKYGPEYVVAAEGKLPDFGNQSASERFHEMFKSS